MKVKVTRNFQITIPAEVRRKMGLKLGDVLEVEYNEEKGEAIIRKLGGERRKLKAGRKLTPDEIEALIAEGMGDNL
ncbi:MULTISPECIES: AbrB/MazE/SpoVT family DNA-binding domain-containing protein [Archaeoglobus]|jgi:AbrB family looped-hinge helix DNA binding protein|uniref:SpoVT-AbrB domain-containing protein n=3 Tax=Archaeoglobus fulgidus TaxID=2234 RepID=O30311_ARCFU|nr:MULTISPECIES: AbrB/MazE/SpoVT family DNA-binding domain-containing protein [Archaeoglobus]AAB91311.1 predicted coding region AF_2359 [Archaeoglobus fulgidus DSM 4304]AIG99348.1 looped-hinge helix DNA binding protein domain protein, AbrB family [Archaeoglobus fulgidus DSM 8774]KUJ94721.1 MAG: hypothetical protein XD40_0042 [Archaeoglobus fulgidus]KUK06241.1 MAG: hypothetical protein XD48_1514 [Archaeoglobus fulgidus]MDI3497835.1 hypothetical protein [Archaeoglobus sp.]